MKFANQRILRLQLGEMIGRGCPIPGFEGWPGCSDIDPSLLNEIELTIYVESVILADSSKLNPSTAHANQLGLCLYTECASEIVGEIKRPITFVLKNQMFYTFFYKEKCSDLKWK